tara:strand:- start:634 stop:1113 length:480 start_codon:yes stop_codon:yes gene_type:complete
MNVKNIIILLSVFIITEVSFANSNYVSHKSGTKSYLLTGEDYITGEDGVPRMSINIWGHVSNPGAYLVYDGIDILTCLSMAGGPLKGANLSSVSIISEDGSSISADLSKLLDGQESMYIKLKPYDTIYIDQTFTNYILLRTGIINTILQLTNLLVTINK